MAAILALSLMLQDEPDGAIRASSPNGVYRFEALPGERHFQFFGDYTSRLLKAGTPAPLWEIRQGKDDPTPFEAWVTDEGYAVVYGKGLSLAAYTVAGKRRYSGNILQDVLTPAEVDEFVVRTSHGFLWSELSHWYVSRFGEKPYFCIRTWWDRRIVLDLEGGALSTVDARLGEHLDREEKRFAVGRLKEAIEARKKLGPDPSHEELHPVMPSREAAVHLAGRLKAADALPLLLEMEAWNFGCDWSSISLPKDVPGEMDGGWGENNFRRGVAHSIRLLGGEPKGHPLTQFALRPNEGAKRENYPTKDSLSDREKRAKELKQGLTFRQVLDTCGAPDSYTVASQGPGVVQTLEYEISSESPYTLNVTIKDGRLSAMEKLTPPLWQRKNHRERQLVR